MVTDLFYDTIIKNQNNDLLSAIKKHLHMKRTLKDSSTRYENTRSFLKTVGVFNILFLC